MKTTHLPFPKGPRPPGSRRSAGWLLLVLLVATVGGWTVGRFRSPPAGNWPWWRGPQVAAAWVGFAWPELPARLVLPAQDLKAVARGLQRARPQAAGSGGPESPGAHWAYWVLDWQGPDGGQERVWISPDGRFFHRGSGPWVHTEPLWRAVQPALARLNQRTFGEPLAWPEVDRLWPWDRVAVLEDLETGRRLRVVRYGGYQHADAEPLTAADTQVLRTLYGGQWSWRRRAMVLVVGQRRIAVSINGMPHGGQVVDDNGFDGHFCIHTRQATTHVSDREDPGHQLMVLKSSGRLVWALREAPPHQVAAWLLLALANGDAATASHMVTEGGTPQWQRLAAQLVHRWQFVEVHRAATAEPHPPEERADGREARVQLDVTLYDRQGVARQTLQWRLVRQDGFWTVPVAQLRPLVRPPTTQVDPGPLARADLAGRVPP